MALFIDPHMSAITDGVVEGKVSDSRFRKAIVWLVGSRLAGTLLVPSAVLIAWVARAI